MGHGVDSIAEHIREHLAYISFEAFDRMFGIPTRFNLDVRVSKSPFINNKHGFEKALGAQQLRLGGLLMEAERLTGHL